VSAAAFVLLRNVLPGWYNDDPTVIALAATIMPVAAAFQLFDGTQVVGGGVLRGFGNPRPAAAFNFVGYYLLALPVGAWLAFRTPLGLAGLWWGLALGLAVVACCLLGWIRWFAPGRAELASDTRHESS
jgi:MATE family multidrug resistance protein